jgi:hypothetical protein
MPEILKVDLMHVGGGLVTGIPATHINDNQMAALENFYPYGTKLVRRGGVQKLTETAHTESLTSLFAYKTAAGVWTLLLGAKSSMCKLAGTAIVQLPIADGRVYDSSDYPWVFYQYKDMAYATRPAAGTLKRITSDYIVDAGIPAPATAPTLVDGAAGAIPAASFYGVYTHLDAYTYNESNYSPASTVLAHAGSKKINWSGIAVSVTPQVSARRIYRTLPDQQGQYFFVAQINNNIDTTFAGDNVLVQDLGMLASVRNGLPPATPQYGDLWQDRLFLTDGVDIYFSEIGLVECFGEESILSVFPDDGHFVRGMRAFGDRFVVGKTNKIHFLSGTDPSNYSVQTLSDRHGCWSYYSMQVAEGKLIWFGGDNFYLSDGTSVEAIGGGIEMRTFIDRIPDAYKDKIVAVVFPENNWYLATCPLDDAAENKAVFVYNYKTGAWTTFTHSFGSGDAPCFLGDFYDENFEHILYSVFYDGHVYRYNYGDQDDGTNFTSKVLTKAFGFDKNGMRKGLKRFYLKATTVGQSITLKVYREGVVIKTRVASLYDTHSWKRYALSTLNNIGNDIQVGIEYSGQDHIEIEGLAMEIVAFMRAGKAL